MPQFDFANVFVPQLFWLAIFFVILYFGVVRTTLPRLGKVMDQRESTIADDLAAARDAKDRADALAEEVRMEGERHREEARGRISAAKDEAAAASAKRLAAADEKLNAKIAKAQERIAAARDEARSSVRDVAAESAQAIVAKLTGTEPARAAALAEVDLALAN
jgi:F-type H+-transporting ATPase subunit b